MLPLASRKQDGEQEEASLSSLLPNSTLWVHVGAGKLREGEGRLALPSQSLANFLTTPFPLGFLCPCPSRTGKLP